MGACWRTSWPLSYTTQMKPGVELVFWELVGKPQLIGKHRRMRIWVHCNLLHTQTRTNTHTHLKAEFLVLR